MAMDYKALAIQLATDQRAQTMSRYSAPSDLDYYDEPWERHERCATLDCSGIVSRGSPFIYCVKCLMDARDAERLRQQRDQFAKKPETV